MTHGVIDLPDRNEYRFRWYEDNRYQLLDPYTGLPNDPWYMRIRHNMDPQPNEWARMRFSPYRPYMVATWVPRKLVAPGVVEFERKRILFDGKKYPDVLIFNKDYELKWALDGNAVDAPEKQGYIYPWTRSRFPQCDARNGRVRVSVDIEPDDIVYGFYFYEELDLICTALDVNPFRNGAVLQTPILAMNFRSFGLFSPVPDVFKIQSCTFGPLLWRDRPHVYRYAIGYYLAVGGAFHGKAHDVTPVVQTDQIVVAIEEPQPVCSCVYFCRVQSDRLVTAQMNLITHHGFMSSSASLEFRPTILQR